MRTLAELRAADARHHLHPFTDHAAMQRAGGTQVITRGEGCYLYDAENRRLLDGLAGLWCVNVGYSRPEIIAAVTRQMEQLPYYCSFFNSTTEPAILLAEKLASLAPERLNHTLFCSGGSEANDTAVKLIRGYWTQKGRPEKRKMLSRTYSYHGVTVAATSLTGLPGCYQPFDLPLPDFVHVPGPYAYASGTGMNDAEYGQWCLEETERVILREGPGTVAAIFVEPVQGAGGVIVPPPGHLQALREMARRHEILFVADEVITAFGRLGAWFASSMWDLDPDLLSLAKGVNSGYLPLGGLMLSDEIAETLSAGGYLAHGFTYSGHPAAAAAALANLAILESEHLIDRTRDDIGPYFQSQLRQLSGHPAVGEVRGYQLIGAVELLPKKSQATQPPAPGTLGARAAALAREEGVIVRGIRELIALSPPLIITRQQVDELVGAVVRSLDRLQAEGA